MTSKHKTINKMQYAKFRNKHNLEKYTKEGLKFMVIEDMQQSLELLENIKYFFYNTEEIEGLKNTIVRMSINLFSSQDSFMTVFKNIDNKLGLILGGKK